MSVEKAVILIEKSMSETSKAKDAYSKASKYSAQSIIQTSQVVSTAADILNGINSAFSSVATSSSIVQFNPNTLTISNGAESIENTNSQSGKVNTNEIKSKSMKLNVTLSYYKTDKVSVQDMIEGFMGLILLPETPRITFLWGAMFFTGSLESVIPKYTQFDSSGTPVFGTVQITIESSNSDTVSSEYWKKQLNKYQ